MPLDPRVERIVKRDPAAELQEFLARRCEEINAGGAAIAQVHWQTPPPDRSHHYEIQPYDKSAPEEPPPLKLGILGLILPWVRRDKELEYENELEHFRKLKSEWGQDKARHDAEQERLRRRFEAGRLTDPAVMSELLAEAFTAAGWPRETRVDFDLEDDGTSLTLDVDLPEAEDMPTASAEPAARGFKLNITKLSEASIRTCYSAHVHGIVFRCIGLAFATLPRLQTVTCAAYTQRVNSGTGAPFDVYLLSVEVSRSSWCLTSFSNLREVEVSECLENFDLRRAMSAGAALGEIVPHARLHSEAGHPDPALEGASRGRQGQTP
jgi:hypothetical protein